MRRVLAWIKAMLGDNLVRRIRPIYHGIKAYLAAVYYGFPGQKLKLVGVTGTKGKTTTTVFIGRLLNSLGIKTGYITSSVINIGQGEFLNKYKMGTLDSVITHRLLAGMAKEGCEVSVIEMTSQGLEQNRHIGLGGFDVGLFLNMFPEHIEAHGGWDNYRKAKAILFANLKLNGWFVANSEDWETEFMWKRVRHQDPKLRRLLSAKDYKVASDLGNIFKTLEYAGQQVATRLVSDFDLTNAFFAANVAAVASDRPLSEALSKIGELGGVPGRMEFVVQHEAVDRFKALSVLVDYAHEPESMKLLLQTLSAWKKQNFFDKIIHVLSADGAGRDDWKKPAMGELSFKLADFTVITTDNYDEKDDPQAILDLLAKNCRKQEKNKKFFKITDRRQAMRKALELAGSFTQDRVLIVSTGVGSEQGLIQPGGKIGWDEREVWREVLEGV